MRYKQREREREKKKRTKNCVARIRNINKEKPESQFLR